MLWATAATISLSAPTLPPKFAASPLASKVWRRAEFWDGCGPTTLLDIANVLGRWETCDECERVHGGDAYKPPLGTADFSGCPLCMQPLPDTPEAWQHHLIEVCVANERRQQQA